MVFVILPDMVISEQYSLYATVLSSVYALSSVLGPVLGGAISSHTNWRWIFYIKSVHHTIFSLRPITSDQSSGPAGALTFVLITVSLPGNFAVSQSDCHPNRTSFRKTVRRLDAVGAILLLAASICMVSALEEGGTEHKWRSAVVLMLLAAGVVFSFLFLLWEKHLSVRDAEQEPVFPWRMATDRLVMGMLLNSLLVGSTFFVLVINLPPRFQIVNGYSSVEAGYHLIALTISTPVGSTIAVGLTQKAKVPPLYILLGSALIQVTGLALMSALSIHTRTFEPAEYGYQVITGVGLGLSVGTVVLVAPLVMSKKDIGKKLVMDFY